MTLYAVDLQTGDFLWRCPDCHEYIRFPDLSLLYLTDQIGRCQGCRAQKILKINPRLISLYMDAWTRDGAWPQSNSWVEALPVTA